MTTTFLRRKLSTRQWLLLAGQKVFHKLLFLLCLSLSLKQTWICITKYYSESLDFSQESVPLMKMKDLPRLSVGYGVNSDELYDLKHPQPYDLEALSRLANITVEDYLLRGMWSPTNVPSMTAEEMFDTVTEPNYRSESAWHLYRQSWNLPPVKLSE